MSLATYRHKRNFERTPEPRGRRGGKRGAARFVIHKHDATRLHYDLRLELDGALKTWAVPKGPSFDPADKRLAIQVEDHPLEYGAFEGVIPKGEYGAGPVIVWDRGTWSPRGDARAELERGHLSFELQGEKLRGGWKLIRMAGRAASEPKKTPWLLMKEKDEWARRGRGADVVAQRPESVASGRRIEELGSPRRRPAAVGASRRARGTRGAAPVDPATLAGARPGALPKIPAPELATLVDATPEGDAWLHEIKYDGYRLMAELRDGRARLITRRGQDWTETFANVAEAVSALPARQALLDGEVVVLNADGTSSFQELQGALKRGRDDFVYFVFDLPHLEGYDLSSVRLEDRKEALARLLADVPHEVVRYSDHVIGRGETFHREACRRHLEGTISKRRDAPYRPQRTRDWLKTKCSARQEFVIGGFTEPSGSRIGFGALLLGVYGKSGGLRYAGRVGTGFGADLLRDLRRRLDRLETDGPPFENPPRASRGLHWVKPRLVAEVSFIGWTRDGILRHPSFQGLRQDKMAAEVVAERPTPAGKAEPASAVRGKSSRPERRPPVREPTSEPPVRDPKRGPPEKDPPRRRAPVREPLSEPPAKDPPKGPPVKEPPGARAIAVAGVALTNRAKVLYPEEGVTKLDLARYMAAVASRMVPQVAARPLMLRRCPEGYRGPCFFQKHPSVNAHSALEHVEIDDAEGRSTYLVLRDVAGLVGLVQMGVLEVHVWGARIDRIEQPDRMVFDLDPDPDAPFTDVVAAASDVRERLERLNLESFLKTTGGKGLHIVVPLRRGPGWDVVKEFSAAVGAGLAREEPERWTTHLAKAKRRGRIFIDTLRNGRGATWIAPYSPRARAGAPVSTPLHWSELTATLRPDRFTVATVPQRLARLGKDPWAGIDSVRQTITAAMTRAATRNPATRRGAA